ncbi:MAG: hypothetical protein CVV46_06185 [Spirochaetae bacterium HGW-Spirochaetae-2]|nr:MAG: hypothetical protein CVV46_06185 [Spirochaetae bacterium HGW-Spirochaetae-2]
MKAAIPEVLIMNLFNNSVDKSLKIDVFNFHKAFYQVKRSSKFQEVMKKIKFCGSPASPYSVALDEALSNLQYAGALSRKNPDLVMYSASENFNKLFEKLNVDFDSEEISILNDLSKEVAHAL